MERKPCKKQRLQVPLTTLLKVRRKEGLRERGSEKANGGN